MSAAMMRREISGWMPTPPEIYRIDVEEYERLASSGILNDPRVELIDGLLVRKMTKKPEHSTKAERFRRLLDRILPAGPLIVDGREVGRLDVSELLA